MGKTVQDGNGGLGKAAEMPSGYRYPEWMGASFIPMLMGPPFGIYMTFLGAIRYGSGAWAAWDLALIPFFGSAFICSIVICLVEWAKKSYIQGRDRRFYKKISESTDGLSVRLCQVIKSDKNPLTVTDVRLMMQKLDMPTVETIEPHVGQKAEQLKFRQRHIMAERWSVIAVVAIAILVTVFALMPLFSSVASLAAVSFAFPGFISALPAAPAVAVAVGMMGFYGLYQLAFHGAYLPWINCKTFPAAPIAKPGEDGGADLRLVEVVQDPTRTSPRPAQTSPRRSPRRGRGGSPRKRGRGKKVEHSVVGDGHSQRLA